MKTKISHEFNIDPSLMDEFDFNFDLEKKKKKNKKIIIEHKLNKRKKDGSTGLF